MYVSPYQGLYKKIVSGKRSDLPRENQLPPIVRADGTNNGFFVKGDALYWQNEDTGGKEPHHVKKITFAEVLALADAKPGAAANPGAADSPYAGKNFTTAQPAPPPPRPPEVSRDAIAVRPGFRVELVAAEPLVMDPIAFDWGPDGKLWVVEMGDYPTGHATAEGKPKAGGRVVYLEDADGDGKYDKRTVFLDGLNMPTSVMVWKKGVLVTAAPDLFYAEDVNPIDPGKAIKRVTLFTGFAEGNPQHRVNGLRWGMDGWIYLANGDSGGKVAAMYGVGNEDPREAIDKRGQNISGRDMRIAPREFFPATDFTLTSYVPPPWILELQSGQSQYGRDRDDFGNWFGSNNPNPGWHYALEDHYLRRNPHFAAPNPRVDLTSDRTIYPISVVHSPSIENHRISPGQATLHSSACSLTIYRDDLYGEHFYGNAFVSEPVHNLVRRMVLRPHGVTFRGERAPGEERREFLASSDPWFRPTTIRTGPDGCLYIADMYRQTIEHPEWIPKEWQKAVDLRAGHDMGRIYRVVPVDKKPRAVPRLDKMDAKQLVAAMDSPSGWQRDMVQMMLCQRVSLHNRSEEYSKLRLAIRNPKSGPDRDRHIEELERLLGTPGLLAGLTKLGTDAKNPAVRVQAICTLETLRMLTHEVVISGVLDPHPAVRRHAARVARAGSSDPDYSDQAYLIQLASDNLILALVADPDAKVRQQLAYWLAEYPTISLDSIGEMREPNPKAGSALGQILLKDTSDPYITAACMSSVLPHLDTVLQHVVSAPGDIAQRSSIIQQLIAVAVAADKLGAIGAMLDVATMPHGDRLEPWQFATLSRLLDALSRKNITLAQLREKADKAEPRDRRLVMTLDRVPQMATVARAAVVDYTKDDALRVAAIDFYLRVGGDQRNPAFAAGLADVRSSPAVQQAAAAALARIGGEKSHATLLSGWKSHPPSLRAAILDALLRQDDGVAALLSAMEKEIVSRHDVDIPRRQPLLTHKDELVRARAAKLLGGAVNSDRVAVIERYWDAMQKAPLEAEAQAVIKGRVVFEKNCAACHRLSVPGGDVGKGIGPDLQKIVDGSQAALLAAILDPNRAVEAKYINYLAEKKDGERVTGIITTETGTSITMVGVDGKEQTLLRSEIESLTSTSLSLMPQGLEEVISPLDMLNLLAFIRAAEAPPKVFENNKPVKIEPDGKGVLTLPASAAEVRGPSLVFEQGYRNLGYWSSEGDYATWTIAVPKDGKYDVALDYALPATVKSNGFQLITGGETLTGVIEGTGNWDTYKTAKVGTIELKAGTHRIVFRSNGPVSGALIDLRTVVLTPAK